jgi:hypothetical protein
MNKRLDLLVSLMLPTQPISPSVHVGGSRSEYEVLASQEDSPFDLPSKLLNNSSLMHVLGLDADFAQVLLREERTTAFEANANAGTRMLVVRHRHIAR